MGNNGEFAGNKEVIVASEEVKASKDFRAAISGLGTNAPSPDYEKKARLKLIKDLLISKMTKNDFGYMIDNQCSLMELLSAVIEHPISGTIDEVFGEALSIHGELSSQQEFDKIAKSNWLSGLTEDHLDTIATTIAKSGAKIKQ